MGKVSKMVIIQVILLLGVYGGLGLWAVDPGVDLLERVLEA